MKRLLLLLASIAAVAPGFGAITVVQTQNGACTTSNGSFTTVPQSGSCGFSASVTAGNVVVLIIETRQNTPAISSLTTAGKVSTYNSAYSLTSGGAVGIFFYCGAVTTTGTETVVANVSQIYFGHLFMLEASGTNGCTADGTATGSSSLSPGSITVSVGSLVINGLYDNTTNSDLVLTAGWTTIGLNNNGGVYRSGAAQYIKAVTTSYNPASTGSTDTTVNGIIAIQAAAGTTCKGGLALTGTACK